MIRYDMKWNIHYIDLTDMLSTACMNEKINCEKETAPTPSVVNRSL